MTLPPAAAIDVENPLGTPTLTRDAGLPFGVQSYGMTDVGRVRDRNEDHFLVAELSRREAGREPQPLVEQLTSVLAKRPRTTRSRGEAFRMALTGADIEEAERQLELLLPKFNLDDPPSLEEDQLAEALATLSKVERAVSSLRAKVNRVHDRLQEELKDRYRENPGEIPREL